MLGRPFRHPHRRGRPGRHVRPPGRRMAGTPGRCRRPSAASTRGCGGFARRPRRPRPSGPGLAPGEEIGQVVYCAAPAWPESPPPRGGTDPVSRWRAFRIDDLEALSLRGAPGQAGRHTPSAGHGRRRARTNARWPRPMGEVGLAGPRPPVKHLFRLRPVPRLQRLPAATSSARFMPLRVGLPPRFRVSMNSLPSGSMHVARCGGCAVFRSPGHGVRLPPAAFTSAAAAVTSGTWKLRPVHVRFPSPRNGCR